MVLVDTSVWVDHLRRGEPSLAGLLDLGEVLVHQFVFGELACGNLRNRQEVLALLKNLPAAPVAAAEEVLYFIERHALMGRGIGYIDAHLLAAVLLEGESRVWTRDRRLAAVAREMRLSYEPRPQ